MIRLEGVTRRYRSAAGERTALDGVDLSIGRGEVFGVVGRSGAGKSTLIRAINRLETPDAGRIFVDDQEITALKPAELRAARRRIGMIFQHFNLLNAKTIEDNVAFPLRLEGRPEAEVKARTAQLLEQLGLAEHARKHPAQLSGGQKQRVGIARALACGPSVLLCDEATSALDPETTEDILTLLDGLNRDLGLTIVLITHQMEVVRRVCDRVAVLKDGKIVEQGATADVFLRPQHPVTRAMLAEGEEAFDASVVPVGARLARLTFRGASTYEPELSRVARSVGVDYSILSGRISRIRGEPYGQLVVAFTGGDAEAAVAQLTARGVKVESV
ncbi:MULTISPECIES: methionine ABC transporter ATP-binding protein [unclassified Brevundimonas]|uniref:methionine ABC transporter ATP-binding protein n=1 Tax=unclassified Brevundimonas TaxID=2622653 RepID=UPI000CFB2504|nr:MULTISPECIES: methionine ABC transporter ATP-binding protein [unclassified Brevundimonas]PRA22448.1 methionine ABC transporter ATP-binding protein [Brevundimonas sp. MYb27]PQZ73775.1 methionine ABC transporter ATP-binding protein [Brevundimonas sp. MYb31]PRB17060.1 methionine ABC transporter ATP-binding protein [Brevundimonas sp. MYb52]PRB37226.1 methionine ABC transporter ATP-binding protein [Brevundimonas sp. MYb46]PRB40975.1 methionine ABC transporter ATP-binding protein [Brevundimonas s